MDFPDQQQEREGFAVEEVEVSALPRWAGRSLAELELRGRFGVTALAIARGDQRLGAPDPRRPLAADDRIVLAGTHEGLARVRGTASEAN